ncbi:MAG: valine--tRNA ligase [Patescibacteria group bacterium]
MDKSFNFTKEEDRIYKHWENSGFFDPDNLNLAKDAKTYTIVLPPPNVTGTLHAGHAGVLTFEDILIRYHRMKGERTLWIPGTDHAAIATQTKVEKLIKEEGVSRHSLGREKFLKRVEEYAKNSHDTIVSQCKKMGASLDWSREAYTLDETRNKMVNTVFKLMYDDGLIYRGERVVNWCPRCHSPLADDEVEYKENKTKLYYFKYSDDLPITIATTRPETKLGDVAVAVNPKDERYKKYIGKEFEVDFVGIKLQLKVIADHGVDMNFGAGALGVTPAHSNVDWQIADNNDLGMIKVIDEDGNIREGFEEFSGKTSTQAREMIVDRIRKAGLLEKEEEIDNNLSLCYRCDTPIEPLPSLQWFVDVNKKVKRLENKSLKEVSSEAVKSGVFGRDKIKIIPESFEKKYFHWMDSLRDWCISRQIWFGHRIPVWYRDSETYVGLEAPEGKGWIRDEDTLDTWFSSGMWTFSTLVHSPDEIKIENNRLVIESEDFKRFHPTQVLETAYDILFFWVARMILMTTYAVNDIPFQDIYLQGLVTDTEGKKMSKSKGNVIDPTKMIEKYGADSTRLSLVVGSTPGNNMRLSEEKIEGFRNLIKKIWNIARYIKLETGGENFKKQSIKEEHLVNADLWILKKLNKLISSVSNDLDNYDFSNAGQRLKDFTWNDLADWYIEATKFKKTDQTSSVLLVIMERLLKLWHPFIPFVTERIWTEFGKSDLIIEDWPDEKEFSDINYGDKPQVFDLTLEIIKSIRNARSENDIEPSRKIEAMIFAGDQTEKLKENEILIQRMRTGIDKINIIESGEKPDDAIFIPVSNSIEIYLIGAIDKDKEKQRLIKSVSNLKERIEFLEKKLADDNFVKKAPKKIVDDEKQRLNKFLAEKNKIDKQLKDIEAEV